MWHADADEPSLMVPPQADASAATHELVIALELVGLPESLCVIELRISSTVSWRRVLREAELAGVPLLLARDHEKAICARDALESTLRFLGAQTGVETLANAPPTHVRPEDLLPLLKPALEAWLQHRLEDGSGDYVYVDGLYLDMYSRTRGPLEVAAGFRYNLSLNRRCVGAAVGIGLHTIFEGRAWRAPEPCRVETIGGAAREAHDCGLLSNTVPLPNNSAVSHLDSGEISTAALSKASPQSGLCPTFAFVEHLCADARAELHANGEVDLYSKRFWRTYDPERTDEAGRKMLARLRPTLEEVRIEAICSSSGRGSLFEAHGAADETLPRGADDAVRADDLVRGIPLRTNVIQQQHALWGEKHGIWLSQEELSFFCTVVHLEGEMAGSRSHVPAGCLWPAAAVRTVRRASMLPTVPTLVRLCEWLNRQVILGHVQMLVSPQQQCTPRESVQSMRSGIVFRSAAEARREGCDRATALMAPSYPSSLSTPRVSLAENLYTNVYTNLYTREPIRERAGLKTQCELPEAQRRPKSPERPPPRRRQGQPLRPLASAGSTLLSAHPRGYLAPRVPPRARPSCTRASLPQWTEPRPATHARITTQPLIAHGTDSERAEALLKNAAHLLKRSRAVPVASKAKAIQFAKPAKSSTAAKASSSTKSTQAANRPKGGSSSKPAAAAPSLVTDPSALSGLKVPELKAQCKLRGLLVGGKRDDLVARLVAAIDAPNPPNAVASNGAVSPNAGVPAAPMELPTAVPLEAPTAVQPTAPTASPTALAPTTPKEDANGAAVPVQGASTSVSRLEQAPTIAPPPQGAPASAKTAANKKKRVSFAPEVLVKTGAGTDKGALPRKVTWPGASREDWLTALDGGTPSARLSTPAKALVGAAFARFDADGDGGLSARELSAFNVALGSGELDEESLGFLTSSFEGHPNGGLTRDGFEAYYVYALTEDFVGTRDEVATLGLCV